MNILLVDSKTETRLDVEERLRESGLRVLSFADADFAFFYLLGHLDEVDAVALNLDGEGGLLRRLEAFGPMAAVTYSGSDLSSGGEIAMELMPLAEACVGVAVPLGYQK